MSDLARVEPTESTDVINVTAATPMEMISHAVQSGATVEMIEKLMALQERWDASQGRKAFDEAISLAKSEIPPIIKNREVDFTSQKGRTNYRHEDLAGIARVVDPILSKYGLSYRYRTSQDGQSVTVTCVLSHRDGFSEETTLSITPDQSGNKNHIQAVGSAATYLQRYTLKMALGLSATQDDDGQSAGSNDTITADQFQALRAKIEDAGACEDKLCAHFKIQELHELPQAMYGRADAMLAQKIAQAGADA